MFFDLSTRLENATVASIGTELSDSIRVSSAPTVVVTSPTSDLNLLSIVADIVLSRLKGSYKLNGFFPQGGTTILVLVGEVYANSSSAPTSQFQQSVALGTL